MWEETAGLRVGYLYYVYARDSGFAHIYVVIHCRSLHVVGKTVGVG